MSFMIYKLLFAIYYYGPHIKDDEMGGAYSTNGREEKRIESFGWKIRRKETTRKS
jgi:hypothetical protein